MKRIIKIAVLSLSCLHFAYAGMLELTQASFSNLPGWSQDTQQKAIPGLQLSCQRIAAVFPNLNKRNDIRASSAWINACLAVENAPDDITAAQARTLIEDNFTPYLVTSEGVPDGLFTGYYEPTIKGSLKKTAYYGVPIYARPRNLVKVRLAKLGGQLSYMLRLKKGHYAEPPTREEIAKGRLLRHTRVIAWIHSNVDRFFLQIQGSGRVVLPNGTSLLVGYDSQNGHPYFPIGKYLADTNAIPRQSLSMQSIQAYLQAHPTQASKIMNLDPSFVFFRVLTTNQPIGAQGVELTPKRSMAVDPSFIPYGMPIWLSTFYPEQTPNGIVSGAPLQRLMIAQDTGGAIRGPVRADIFFGSGSAAEWNAGHMQSKGTYWLLLPNGANPSELEKS
ncbi:MAG: MltA domain-containing protein [Gammaproteobacteria bacterium]|nr:MltA domain-containing protein [Gammaproteobacteria bacterium]